MILSFVKGPMARSLDFSPLRTVFLPAASPPAINMKTQLWLGISGLQLGGFLFVRVEPVERCG